MGCYSVTKVNFNHKNKDEFHTQNTKLKEIKLNMILHKVQNQIKFISGVISQDSISLWGWSGDN